VSAPDSARTVGGVGWLRRLEPRGAGDDSDEDEDGGGGGGGGRGATGATSAAFRAVVANQRGAASRRVRRGAGAGAGASASAAAAPSDAQSNSSGTLTPGGTASAALLGRPRVKREHRLLVAQWLYARAYALKPESSRLFTSYFNFCHEHHLDAHLRLTSTTMAKVNTLDLRFTLFRFLFEKRRSQIGAGALGAALARARAVRRAAPAHTLACAAARPRSCAPSRWA